MWNSSSFNYFTRGAPAGYCLFTENPRWRLTMLMQTMKVHKMLSSSSEPTTTTSPSTLLLTLSLTLSLTFSLTLGFRSIHTTDNHVKCNFQCCAKICTSKYVHTLHEHSLSMFPFSMISYWFVHIITNEMRQAGNADQMGIECFFSNESFTCSGKRRTLFRCDFSENRSNSPGVHHKYSYCTK